MTLPHWLIGDAVGLDELGNAVLLDGDAHETISAHCGAQIALVAPCLFCSAVCRILGFFFTNHCTRAWIAERHMVEASASLPGAHDAQQE